MIIHIHSLMEIVVAGLLSKYTPATRSINGDRCGGTVVEKTRPLHAPSIQYPYLFIFINPHI
ncbi:MAG: hypothetical protein ACKPKO_35110 [Candidatus Fonsibacter sp.]